MAKSMKPFIGRFALFSSFAPDDVDDEDSFFSLAGDAGGGDAAVLEDAAAGAVAGTTLVAARSGEDGVCKMDGQIL